MTIEQSEVNKLCNTIKVDFNFALVFDK